MGPFEKSFWSPEEWSRAQVHFAAGKTIAETAPLIGKTYKQLAGKVLWERMTEAQKVARRARINARRHASGEYKSTPRPDKPVVRPRACPKQIADRDRRHTIMPRDLTAAFFGDPLPGYSALDQERAV
jgi:hypothetical protein